MKTLRLTLSLLALFSLVACGDDGAPALTTLPADAAKVSAAEPHATKRRIGLVMKTLTNPFFIEMEKGARQAENELGIELLLKTGAEETSIEQQIQIIDDLIAAKVDAIVIAPGDSKRVIPALKKAADQGIKLVNIDNRLDPAELKRAGLGPVPLISVDNELAAYASAKYIANGAAPGTQAAIIEGIRGADNAQQRRRGAVRAFAEGEAIELVASESANWKIDEGYAVTARIFAEHPHVGLLFAANDMMALGALKYLQESARHDVKIAAYDGLSEAIEEIKAGRLAATVDQQAAEQGRRGIALAVSLLEGKEAPPVTLVDTRLLTADAYR